MPSNTGQFLKWAGSKRQLLPEIRLRLPVSFGTYYEPFVGAGAVLFDLNPVSAVIGDANERLVRTYRAIQHDVGDVVEQLERHQRLHCKDHFLSQREVPIDGYPYSNAAVAAWMIYLNRTCFNGLYRVNKAGKFNVPFGDYDAPDVVRADLLRATSARLRHVNILSGDFADTVLGANRGDFVYLDPPYVPLSPTSDFTSYTAGKFGETEHRRLAATFATLDRRGCKVMLSNSGAPLCHELYRKWDLRTVKARRSINSKATGRGKVDEILVTNY